MTISKSGAWIAGTAAVGVLVLLGAWMLLISPMRTQAADLADQRVQVESNNAMIRTRTAQLKAQFETLDAQRAKLAEVRAQMPADAEVPALLRQLEGYAASSGATLTGVTPGTATPFVPTGTDPAQATGTAVAAGLYAVPLTVTSAGTFAETELFLKNLQADMRRFLLIDNLSVTAGGNVPGEVDTTITGKIFVLRDEAAAPAQPATTAPATTAPAADAAPSTETVS
ncbi:hypothetical protein NUM3379_04970 [Kineococcus sp. NUM-3379]